MNCDDIQNALYVYLDGEFAELEARDFERHVDACARCTKLMVREGRFLEAVRDAAPQDPAPAGLRDRLALAIDNAPSPLPATLPVAPRPRGWAFALAAAALVLVAVGLSVGTTASAENTVIDESVATHQKSLPMEVRGSHRNVSDFLQQNVPFAVDLPTFQDPTARLVGARLTRVHGREAVLLNYEVDGERMSVIQLAAETSVDDAEPAVQSKRGFDVWTFKRKGVLNSFVGRDARSVRRLVRAAYRR